MRSENYLHATCYRHFSVCILGVRTHKQWYSLGNGSSSIIIHKSKQAVNTEEMKTPFCDQILIFPSNYTPALTSFFFQNLCPGTVSFFLSKSQCLGVNGVMFSVDT